MKSVAERYIKTVDVKKYPDENEDDEKMLDSNSIVDEYLNGDSWAIEENSNAPFGYGAMQKHFAEEVSKKYWLDRIYTKEIKNSHNSGLMHIHDLGGLTLYCCGYSLESVIQKGVVGIPNVPRSEPAKHLSSIINHIVNVATIFQNEIMGAVAFNSLDTYLSPYVKEGKLDFKEVKQAIQNLIFSLNSNSRSGSEPAFTNITFDLTPPSDLKNKRVMIGDTYLDYTYGECQEEMNMINNAFFEIMLEGDADGKPLSYPIPTYNIHNDFDWESPEYEGLWDMAGKYGYPYFANFINSDLDVTDVRSMCCRLNLDLTELKKRNGGLFGSGDSTGSIGVVTVNLPRIAYMSKGSEKEFFATLKEIIRIGVDSLEIKREWLQKNILDGGAIPAYMEYVGTIRNHFSTIGMIGLNEVCENMFGEDVDITTEQGKSFALEVLDFMLDELVEAQKRTGNLYNLEATPAEGCATSLAVRDRELFPEIITRGTEDAPYYTNSCHMPVSKVTSVTQLLNHQDELQVKFTGGTVVHVYLDGPIPGEQAKHTIRTICENYRLPYVSLSPISAYCDTHGRVNHVEGRCPVCGEVADLYQRVTGYIRKVNFFNKGKKSEFAERVQL